MYSLFSTITWNGKLDAFVEKTIKSLISQFPPLKYFNTYFTAHLKKDLALFDSAIASPATHSNAVNLTEDEKKRVVKAV